MRRLAYLIALLAVLSVPSSASADDPAIFFTVCPTSHTAANDPIVFPGQPGATHSHEFAGAWSTDAFSTLDTLRRSGTTCDVSADTAGYWTPTLYKDGQRVPLLGTYAYFTDGIHLDRASVKAFPPGLKMVADMSKRPRDSGWHCGDATLVENGGTMSNTTIPTCPGGDAKLQSYVQFPECWDGKNLDSPDHRSHMAYAQRNADQARIGCPSTHPVPVPQLGLKTRYDSYGGSGFTLSSGAPSTMHADFFNAWDQTELERLVKRCINDSYRNGEPCRGQGIYTPNPSFPAPTPPPPLVGSYVDAVNADNPLWFKNQVYAFNGGSEQSLPDLGGPIGDFTVEFEFKEPAQGTNDYLFSAVPDEIGVYSNAGTIRAYSKGQPLILATPHTINATHHLVYTRKAGVTKLYIDNVLVGSATGGASTLMNPQIWRLGNYFEGTYARWNGTLSRPAFYKKALSAARVAAHYAAR